MVDKPPADELHSPPRRVTCNSGTLVSGEQDYKNNGNKREQLEDTKIKKHSRFGNCQLLVHIIITYDL